MLKIRVLIAGGFLVFSCNTQAELTGTLELQFDDLLRGGGVVAAGASLSGREDGIPNASAVISIAGIPAGATVYRALLYWTISGGSDVTATINTFPITGIQRGAVGNACWGVNNWTFRADVTPFVLGNGSYTISGLPSSTVFNQPDTDGVALLVVYQDPASPFSRRVLIRDGGVSSNAVGDVFSDTFTGLSLSSAASGRFHLVVGDGQPLTDGALIFDGVNLGTSQFQGNDGPLWDVNSYDVGIPAAQADVTWSHTLAGDCLVYQAAILDFGVASESPVGTCSDLTAAAIAAARDYQHATQKVGLECGKKQSTDCTARLVEYQAAYDKVVSAGAAVPPSCK